MVAKTVLVMNVVAGSGIISGGCVTVRVTTGNVLMAAGVAMVGWITAGLKKEGRAVAGLMEVQAVEITVKVELVELMTSGDVLMEKITTSS